MQPLKFGLDLLKIAPDEFIDLVGKKGRWFIDSAQSYLLKKTLAHAHRNSQFYKEKWKDIEVGKIQSVQDLQKLPITTDKEFTERSKDFLCVKDVDVARVNATQTKSVYFTGHDLDIVYSTKSLGFRMMGLNNKDIVLNLLPMGVSVGGESTNHALEKIGATLIPLGFVDPKTAVEFINRFKPTVVISTPSLLEAIEEHHKSPSDFGIEKIVTSGEPLGPKGKELLKEKWKAELFERYGSLELGGHVAFECKAHNGMHINDFLYVTEVVDDHLIFTTLGRDAMPFVRYDLGDLGAITNVRCECGLYLTRINKLLGRSSQLVVVGSKKVFPRDIANALEAVGIMKYKLQVNGTHVRVEVNGDAKKAEDALLDIEPIYYGVGKKFLSLEVKSI